MARSAVVACARLERSDYTLFPPPSCHRAPSSGFPESLTIQPNCQQRSERASVGPHRLPQVTPDAASGRTRP